MRKTFSMMSIVVLSSLSLAVPTPAIARGPCGIYCLSQFGPGAPNEDPELLIMCLEQCHQGNVANVKVDPLDSKLD